MKINQKEKESGSFPDSFLNLTGIFPEMRMPASPVFMRLSEEGVENRARFSTCNF